MTVKEPTATINKATPANVAAGAAGAAAAERSPSPPPLLLLFTRSFRLFYVCTV